MGKQQAAESDMHGEGNKVADRRYRKGVRDTVEENSAEEMADKARNLSDEELREARQAERDARERAER